jgi:hypothetical protein
MRTALAQGLAHRVGGFAAHAGQHVAVGVEVIATEECPSNSWRSFGWTFLWNRSDAQVCPRSWKVIWGRSARLRSGVKDR